MRYLSTIASMMICATVVVAGPTTQPAAATEYGLYRWRSDAARQQGDRPSIGRVVARIEALKSEEKGVTRMFEWVVAIDRGKSALIARYGDGMPYLILSNGVVAWYDRHHGGKIEVCEDVNFETSVRLDPVAGLALHITAGKRSASHSASQLEIDLTQGVQQIIDPAGQDGVMGRSNLFHNDSICEIGLGGWTSNRYCDSS